MAFLPIDRNDGTISATLAWLCGLLIGINILIAVILFFKNYRRVAFQALVMPFLYWPIYGFGTWGIYFLVVHATKSETGSGIFLLIVPIAFVMIFLSAWVARRIFVEIPWPPVARVPSNS
jgi:hypothetical protein